MLNTDTDLLGVCRDAEIMQVGQKHLKDAHGVTQRKEELVPGGTFFFLNKTHLPFLPEKTATRAIFYKTLCSSVKAKRLDWKGGTAETIEKHKTEAA